MTVMRDMHSPAFGSIDRRLQKEKVQDPGPTTGSCMRIFR
jgi:hypothetical protein